MPRSVPGEGYPPSWPRIIVFFTCPCVKVRSFCGTSKGGEGVTSLWRALWLLEYAANMAGFEERKDIEMLEKSIVCG